MGTYRLRSGRGLVGAVVWALLASAAALEIYDEAPTDIDTATYQDDNSLDTGPAPARTGPDLALAKDVLLYKLIRALQGRERPTPRYRPDWPSEYQPREPGEPRGPREHRELRHIDTAAQSEKDGVNKRFTNELRGSRTSMSFRGLDLYRPQPKWKIKKGKVLGSQMVCYFKLCAFRSPV